MNAKRCKALRREAEAKSVGMPKRAPVLHMDGSLRNSANSTRGVYRQLKKAA